MQKNFKLILSIIIVLLAGALAFGQEESKKIEYKEVTLDGKPAKLNVLTGEITFVNPNDKTKPVKFDDYVKNSNKQAKDVIASNSVSSSQPIIHTVKEGENLLKISQRYGASLTDLKRINNLETTLVKIGQKLRVSHFDPIENNTEAVSKPIYVKNVSEEGFHIVKKGETLYRLANNYGITVSELKQYNGLNSNLIKVGQKLLLPNSNIETENTDDTVTSWRVVKGDTLFSISLYTGTTVSELKRINGLNNNIIKVGQQIDFISKSATAKK
ncbi:LysM peptidoglycan-binding domain-containing protein [Winogradskyella sp. PE311]|uniref:LysM peptidoglycan-binding domain-containing protein n=1 Tax=Winogradskyella sp. PE311 TaxID=3366943 RepID=UPI00398171EC